MQNFIKPDWENSNLNISATLAEFLGAPNNKTTLPIIKQELEKNYKNIVFICLDGMGINPININLKTSDFLRKNIVKTLTSTFPSTTTNATTSLTCNLYPLEHGWLGWSLHFNEISKNIDIYPHCDSLTGERVAFDYPLADNSNCYFDNVKTNYNITPVFPHYVQTKCKNKIIIESEDDLCNSIKEVCNKPGNQFIYSYFPEPDATMHEFGVSSPQAKEKIKSINKKLETLFKKTQNTLFVITADHGQVDIEDYVEFYKDKELNALLKCVPFLDARTPAFIVKPGMEKEFETKFAKKYGKDFILHKSKDLIEQGYFGKQGDKGFLLGDYIAVGTHTHKIFLPHKNAPRFKGHHTSLTGEMLVPLILLKN